MNHYESWSCSGLKKTKHQEQTKDWGFKEYVKKLSREAHLSFRNYWTTLEGFCWNLQGHRYENLWRTLKAAYLLRVHWGICLLQIHELQEGSACQTETADIKLEKHISWWILKLSVPEGRAFTMSWYFVALRNPLKFLYFSSEVDYVRLM